MQFKIILEKITLSEGNYSRDEIAERSVFRHLNQIDKNCFVLDRLNGNIEKKTSNSVFRCISHGCEGICYP